jgi:hypothetical protein
MASRTGFRAHSVEMLNSSAETIMLGPIVIFELLAIKLLNHPRFAAYRSNIIATLTVSRHLSSEITSVCGEIEQTAVCS